MNAIQVDNLCIEYKAKGGKTVHAVNDLSFAVEPGEIVGFLGPNGAGKSSTLKALMGFATPTSGSCKLLGVSAGKPEARQRVGYLPEVANYYPYLTPFETLTLYGELQGLRGRALREEVSETLDQLGLSTHWKKMNRTLSKGQLQRVGIAQALLGHPELLILDEVTSGLDPIGRRELRELLIQRQRAGCTLFFSSHELDEVDNLCSRILLIDKGRLIEERDMSDLRAQLTRFSLVFKGAIQLDNASTLAMTGGETCATFKTKADMLLALQKLSHKGATILDVTATEDSLEDYFVETLGWAA